MSRYPDPREIPYRSTYHAIGAAYASEVAVAFGGSHLAAACGGRPEYVAGDWYRRLTQLEAVAQGAVALSLLHRALSPDAVTALDAFHTIPESRTLWDRKKAACEALRDRLAATVAVDRDYALAVVLEWCGEPQEHPKLWAARIGVTVRTLRTWANGRGRRPGMVPLLNRWLFQAYDEADEALKAAGLVG